jgi:hypothetical protein
MEEAAADGFWGWRGIASPSVDRVSGAPMEMIISRLVGYPPPAA